MRCGGDERPPEENHHRVTPQQDSNPASAASNGENASMSDVEQEDALRDVVGSSSG
jgi:hypothetical protein